MAAAAPSGDEGHPPASAPPAPPPAAAAPSVASWREGLDPDIASHPIVTNLKDTHAPGAISSLAKQLLDTQKALGKQNVGVPGEGASEADWSAFYTKLGRPETHEKYDLSQFKPPEGVPWDAELQAPLVQMLHQAGITQKQLEKILPGYAEVVAKDYQTKMTRLAEAVVVAENQLKQEFGGAYDVKKALAWTAWNEIFGAKASELSELTLADGSRLGDNPDIVRSFVKVGEAMAPHGLVKGQATSYAMTPDQAKAELRTLEGGGPTERTNPLWNNQHPQHKAIVARRNELYQIAYPEGEQTPT